LTDETSDMNQIIRRWLGIREPAEADAEPQDQTAGPPAAVTGTADQGTREPTPPPAIDDMNLLLRRAAGREPFPGGGAEELRYYQEKENR